MRLSRFVRSALLPLLGAAFVLASLAGPALAKDRARSSAPDFSLRDLNGKRVKLSDFKGKVVIVNFWATWCAPCMQELPYLDRYQKKYGKDLVVLAIATDGPETASRVQGVVKRKKWKMRAMHDKDGRVVSKLNPRGNNPYTVFIDRKGRTAYVHEGYAPGDEKGYERWVQKLIAEK